MLEALKYGIKDLILNLKYEIKYEKILILDWFFLIGLSSGIYYVLKGAFVGKVKFLGKYVDYLTFMIIVWFTTNAIGDAISKAKYFSIRRDDLFTHPLAFSISWTLWNGLARISRVFASIVLFILLGILGLKPILFSLTNLFILLRSLPFISLLFLPSGVGINDKRQRFSQYC